MDRYAVFLNPVGKIGGAEKVLLMAIEAWMGSGPNCRARLITLSDGPLHDQAIRLGAEAITVPLPTTLSEIGDTQLKSSTSTLKRIGLILRFTQFIPSLIEFRSKLRREILVREPCLIHSNGVKTHLLLSTMRCGKMLRFWHLHDFYSERPLVGKLLRRAVSKLATGVAISNAVAADTHRVLPNLNIRTVLNAVDTKLFCESGTDSIVANLDELSGLPPTNASILRVGLIATYANWKGHHQFLEAFDKSQRLLASEGIHLRGYIIGGPIYATVGSQTTREELVAMARSLGIESSIGFIPFQNDTVSIYRALDVVVHASVRPEPFGLTIVEAMACGRAVIAANSGGAAEIITDGLDALAHVPGDVDGLANGIAKLARDAELRASLGLRARTTVETRFEKARFCKEMADVWNSVCQ